MALSHIGHGKQIGNVDTERSAEANACLTYYDLCVSWMLRQFPWPFATKIVALALVQEDPNDEWDYEYRMPADSMALRRILTTGGIRNDSRSTRVPYRIAQDSQGAVIWTDQEDAEVEYTFHETSEARFAPDFAEALSFRIALYIIPRLTRDDHSKLRRDVAALYQVAIDKARAAAANEEQVDEERDAASILAREDGGYTDRPPVLRG